MTEREQTPATLEIYNPTDRVIPAGSVITWVGDCGFVTLPGGSMITFYTSEKAAEIAQGN